MIIRFICTIWAQICYFLNLSRNQLFRPPTKDQRTRERKFNTATLDRLCRLWHLFKHMKKPLLLAALAAALLSACGCQQSANPPAAVPVIRPRIIESLPHDPAAFTQGLLIDGDYWLESTGRYGHSELREVERQTGRVVRSVPLAPALFGEGLALLDGRLYQLTWRERVCIVYDRATMRETARFAYHGEGWGLTNDDRQLYMSDGSAAIRVINPADFSEIRRFTVTGPDGPEHSLNELEWIEGEIWANIFNSSRIVRFDPDTGKVLGYVDLGYLPLDEHAHPQQDVLNGIAYDHNNREIWVTGKNWKALYRIEWPPKPTAP